MKKREDIYVYLVVIAFALAIFVISLQMEAFSSKLLPLIISGMILVLAAAALIRGILKKESPTTKREEPTESWHAYSRIGAWIVGFFLGIYLLGFIIAIPIFLLSYLKTHATGWFAAITITVLMTAFVYGVFQLALQVDFPRGLLLSWLGY